MLSFLWSCLLLLHLSHSGVLLDFQNLPVMLFELSTKICKLTKFVSKFRVRKRMLRVQGYVSVL